MIQDIAPHIFHNEFRNRTPKADDCLIAIKDQYIYMIQKKNIVNDALDDKSENRKNNHLNNELKKNMGDTLLEFISFQLLWDFCGTENDYKSVFLFEVDGISYFLADGQDEGYDEFLEKINSLPDVTGVDVKSFRYFIEEWKIFTAVTAFQLDNWYKNRKFCGRCGNSMVKSKKERAMVCPHCGLTEYPKICPAVIIGITNGDKIMMTKYAGRSFKHYALVAGFTEIGENFEATVKREVMEEVGLKVKNITYYKSQPWAFTDTILAGFYCQLDGSEEYHMDTEELSVAEWVSRDDIPPRENDISLTGEMMEAFRTKTYPQYKVWEEDIK